MKKFEAPEIEIIETVITDIVTEDDNPTSWY